MDTCTKSLFSLSLRGSPDVGLPAHRLQGLLGLSAGLLAAEGELEIVAALGHYLANELNSAESLLLVCGEPDFACALDLRGRPGAASDRHSLMAAARAGLRGVVTRSGSSIGVARLTLDPVQAALVVRWQRHRSDRVPVEQDALLYYAAELTAKALGRHWAIERARNQTDAAYARELARRSRLEDEMRVESLTDSLTGLANRRGFFLAAEPAFHAARRRRSGSAVIFADIDGLKIINDDLGHQTGDALIRQAAAVFRQSFRSADIIARLGGDEFVAYTLDDSHPEQVLRRIENNIEQFNARSELPYLVWFSTGVVACDPLEEKSLADYLVTADQKMYERKQMRLH